MNGCDLHGVSPPKCYIYIYNLSMNGCDLHGVSPPKCYIYTTCVGMDVIFMVLHHLNVIYIQPVYEWM